MPHRDEFHFYHFDMFCWSISSFSLTRTRAFLYKSLYYYLNISKAPLTYVYTAHQLLHFSVSGDWIQLNSSITKNKMHILFNRYIYSLVYTRMWIKSIETYITITTLISKAYRAGLFYRHLTRLIVCYNADRALYNTEWVDCLVLLGSYLTQREKDVEYIKKKKWRPLTSSSSSFFRIDYLIMGRGWKMAKVASEAERKKPVSAGK